MVNQFFFLLVSVFVICNVFGLIVLMLIDIFVAKIGGGNAAVNLIKRAFGFVRGWPAEGVRVESRMTKMTNEIAQLRRDLNVISKSQKGGSLKKSYNIKSLLIYFNICFALGSAIFLTLYPSYLKTPPEIVTANIPSFTIY